MACTVGTLSGVKLEIGTAVAVASCDTELDISDLAAVANYTIAGAFNSVGFSGQEWDTIELKPAGGGKKTIKTSLQPGILEGEMFWEVGEAGMVLLESAYESDSLELALKLTYPNGQIRYGQGIVTKLSEPSGAEDTLLTRGLTITLNHKPEA